MAIKINIGTLGDGSHQIELISDAKELGLDAGLLKDKIRITIDLFKAAHQIDMKISLAGTMTFACDRCLDVYELPFEKKFEQVFVQKSQREEAFDDDYIRTYSPFMKTVDITNDIKEYIILSIPMRKVPAETPEGTCTWCGKTKEYWQNLITPPVADEK
jgi:uncharacterized metal-binding protein YceD (DUF177 family)